MEGLRKTRKKRGKCTTEDGYGLKRALVEALVRYNVRVGAVCALKSE